MPPTVMTPRFTPCCGLCVVLVCPAAVLLPPELVFALEIVLPPEIVFPAELAFPPAAMWPPCTAPPFLMCAEDVPPLLTGVGAPDVAPLVGVPVPELLTGEDVGAGPAAEAATGC